jgi:SM-20-related protein
MRPSDASPSGAFPSGALLIDLDAFRAEPLRRDPFDHVVVPGFVAAAAQARIGADFPAIRRPGSHPVGALRVGGAFAALLAELESPAVTDAFAAKFGVDLAGRPRLVTVRGRTEADDGAIHTDSATKILTALIYLNEGWTATGGCLRLLRSADDLEDFAVEVPPAFGTLIAFRRSERSWHGHHPFAGERRAVQLNWVTSATVLRREKMRLGLSAAVKRLLPFR